MRLISALVFGALLCPFGVNGVARQAAQSPEKQSQAVFPTVSAYALSKSHVNLPADFAGQSNLLLLSFEREQQKDVETWVPMTKELQKANPTFRAYMLPIFSRQNILYRWWENSSLRSDTNDPEWLEFTVPLYVDKRSFRNDLKIASEDAIVVLLVEKSGKVLWRSAGPLTDEKRAALIMMLSPSSAGGTH